MIQPSAQEFLEACGAKVPLRLEVQHRARGEIIPQILPLPLALIGCDERADLLLDDEAVSHRHAYLQMAGGRWWWVDLGSRTGTQGAETTAISSPKRRSSRGSCASGLLPPQGIGIGPYVIRLAGAKASEENGTEAPPNPLTSEADDPWSLPRWTLEFHGTAGQRTWMVDRPLTLVGRAAFCKVRLHSPRVSRIHCALVNTPSGLWFVDLLGREGTFLKGEAVRWARLEPDDELQIHPFSIRVRRSPPPALWIDPRSRVADSAARSLIPSPLGVPANVNDSLLLPLLSQFSLMQQQMFDQFQHTLLMMAQTFGNLHREQLALVRQELEQVHDLTRQLRELQSPDKQPTKTPPPRLAQPQKPANQTSSVPNPLAANGGPPPAVAARNEGDVHLWLSRRLATLQQERQTRWQKILNVLKGKGPEV